MAAANRDPGTFPDPEQFDPSRAANTHLAFGAGAHSCLGQALARTELQVTLEVLLDNCATGRAGDEAGLHPLKDRRSLNEAREF
jgi:cytochrome P450